MRLFGVFSVWVVFHLVDRIKGARVKRVIGGEQIDIDRVPYVISLEYRYHHLCGGAILNENWVMTAAHCFGKSYYINRYLVRVGTDLSEEGGTLHRLVRVLRYPNFTIEVVDNDVALIELYPPLNFSDKVRPIELPNNSSQPSTGNMLTVLGWGFTKEEGDPSKRLRYVTLPIYPHDECKDIYKKTLNVTDQMLCVGYRDGGKDACLLDSGGPLVNGTTVMGIVSWGMGCARALSPGVYTNLSAPQVRNWILSVIRTK